MKYKDEFLSIFDKCVTRDGKEEFLKWLESTDFFIAPASSKYHSAYEEGLTKHSLNVYKLLKKHNEEYGHKYSDETVAICGLLHDVCKANFYTISMRNVKNERGQWEQKPYYSVDDQFPYGHGEKSVFLIDRYLKLTDEEAIAIRWHMGGFDDSVKAGGFTISHAYERYPIAVLLHMADLEATYFYEQGEM